MSQARQRILPFFLPMRGCPARCVFCDQHAISGRSSSPTAQQIAEALRAFPPDPAAQLAYYGGSFTCLPREEQRFYLELAAPALAEQRIGSIRISTRPDAVDAETCAFLYRHGVRTVELGVQSFADEVLRSSGRGYNAQQAEQACRCVQQQGLSLGVQLMTGLPADTDDKARSSMQQALQLGARLLRIYPTLVLEHTPLAELYRGGSYQPQTLEQAVSLCADLLAAARAAGAQLLRMGLNPSAELEAALIAGPYHPAFGSLVREELRARQLAALLEQAAYSGGEAQLLCAAPDIALLYGQKRRRYLQMQQRWPQLQLSADAQLEPGQLVLLWHRQRWSLTEQEYCVAQNKV